MSGDILDLRIAMLPCITGYGEIAMKLIEDPDNKIGNAYLIFIST